MTTIQQQIAEINKELQTNYQDLLSMQSQRRTLANNIHLNRLIMLTTEYVNTLEENRAMLYELLARQAGVISSDRQSIIL